MAGVGRPVFLGRLVSEIKKKYPKILVQYHGHSGPGFSVASMLEVARAGAEYIDVAMVDCMVSMMHTYIANYSANGIIPERHGNRDPLSAPADCYKAKDGYVVMHAGEDKTYELLKKIKKPIGKFVIMDYNTFVYFIREGMA